MTLLIKWLLTSLALLATAYIVPGFKVKGFRTALVAALVIGLLNITIGWILGLLTLPLTILTLGLFFFVLNAFLLKIAAGLVDDFEIDGWVSAILGAIVLAVINVVLRMIVF